MPIDVVNLDWSCDAVRGDKARTLVAEQIDLIARQLDRVKAFVPRDAAMWRTDFEVVRSV
jgi:hypothetical protein